MKTSDVVHHIECGFRTYRALERLVAECEAHEDFGIADGELCMLVKAKDALKAAITGATP